MGKSQLTNIHQQMLRIGREHYGEPEHNHKEADALLLTLVEELASMLIPGSGMVIVSSDPEVQRTVKNTLRAYQRISPKWYG